MSPTPPKKKKPPVRTEEYFEKNRIQTRERAAAKRAADREKKKAAAAAEEEKKRRNAASARKSRQKKKEQEAAREAALEAALEAARVMNPTTRSTNRDDPPRPIQTTDHSLRAQNGRAVMENIPEHPPLVGVATPANLGMVIQAMTASQVRCSDHSSKMGTEMRTGIAALGAALSKELIGGLDGLDRRHAEGETVHKQDLMRLVPIAAAADAAASIDASSGAATGEDYDDALAAASSGASTTEEDALAAASSGAATAEDDALATT